jgi:DNA-binding NarL/FixJ family response regulator
MSEVSLAERVPVIRIAVCDEQSIFRHGLRRLLETAPGFRIVGETADRAKAVTLVGEFEPDVLLLGVARPGGSSLDILRELQALGGSVRTILLAASMDSDGVNDALKLGASGVVPKDASADVLFDSIECVMAGQSCVGRERIADLATSVRRFDVARRQAKAFGLTSRELEIVEAVVSSETNKAIAQRFGISENTVKRHLMHIYDKVGASNRLELAIFAAYHQLIDAV